MKKQLSLLVGSSLLAAGAVAMSATTASALTSANTGVTCSNSGFTGVTSCEGPFSGNNSNQNLDGLFGKDWEGGSFVSGEIKVDNGTGGSNSGFGFSSNPGDNKQSGTWTLDSSITDTYSHGMFVVKAANYFSAYLWDGISDTGSWDVDGVKPQGPLRNGNFADLSHFSFYGFGPRDPKPPMETVPEPASMLGLLAVGVVAAGGALKQKKA